MKKTFVSIMLGLFMAGLSGNVWAGSVVAADLACTNPAGCVQDYEISDSAVTAPKIAAGAVTNVKISDGAVTNSKIATGAVTTTNIAGGAVTTATIANGAVTDTQISGTISGSKLGAHIHNGSDIADGTIGTSKISDGAVTNGKLAEWAVTGTKIADYSVTDTKISSSAVSTPKIADGAITDAKISGTIDGSKLGTHTHNGSEIVDGTVTASKISDGAITDAKIAGPISASKLEKAANVVVVAKSGGDFTNIAEALSAINPSADNPYVVKVMPGTYNNTPGMPIVMKNYVHLMGSGKDVTTITQPSPGLGTLISCASVTNVTISGFTIRSDSFETYQGYNPHLVGIALENSSFVTIENNYFTGGALFAVVLNWEATNDEITIRNNVFTNMGAYFNSAITIVGQVSNIIVSDNKFKGNWRGIFMNTGSPVIERNIFSGNASTLYINGGSATIKDNIISENGTGLEVRGGSPVVIQNKIVGNVDNRLWGGTPHVSFNIVDSISIFETNYTGKYNIKPDGTDIL